jgi:uncharacterized membrane protein YebE (DUF533 family)
METQAFLDQLLQAGRDWASQGKTLAEQGLGIPEAGPERDATLSAMGKGAMAAGALALLLGTGTGRKITGGAFKLGGLAALGGLAYQAYRHWQGDGAATAEIGAPIDQLSGAEAEQRSLALLKAMIAAANADGHIDAAERQRIHEGFRRLGLEERMAALIDTELSAPVDAASVARGADSPEAAAEIYLASRLVIDPDHPSEQRYLEDLARHLALDPGLVSELETQVKQA